MAEKSIRNCDICESDKHVKRHCCDFGLTVGAVRLIEWIDLCENCHAQMLAHGLNEWRKRQESKGEA